MQVLFRPVSMCIPDLEIICEIMLLAEGFQNSKVTRTFVASTVMAWYLRWMPTLCPCFVQNLSRKFVILYKLCEQLLSKSRHYDWKLRAIKTTLYVAGGMKRAAPELSEDAVSEEHSSWCPRFQYAPGRIFRNMRCRVPTHAICLSCR
jgi:dynein heavy chain, axonemal